MKTKNEYLLDEFGKRLKEANDIFKDQVVSSVLTALGKRKGQKITFGLANDVADEIETDIFGGQEIK